MMRKVAVCMIAAMASPLVFAAPILPTITSDDFNFGAGEPVSPDEGMSFYDPRGADADWLTLHPDRGDRELTAYWDIWPVGGTPLPIFNAAGEFGGDIAMQLAFDGEDADPGLLDVSLTGAGRNDAGADVVLSGALPDLGIAYGPLLEIEIFEASLYGNAGDDTYAVEAIGVITFANPALFGDDTELVVGGQGAVRGHIDFVSLTLPEKYDPSMTGYDRTGGGYSGEVGVVQQIPEPASIAVLLSGLGLLWRRR